MGISDHLTGLLRNLFVDQEATVRTGHGTMDWFKIGKGVHQVHQGVYCHPAYLTYMQSTSCEMLRWSKDGIKISRRNINNLRYTDDTTLMTETEQNLKSPLMKVKWESEKAGLILNVQQIKIMASSPITSWQIDGQTIETMMDFIVLGSIITADSDCSHEIKRRLLLGRKAMSNPR